MLTKNLDHVVQIDVYQFAVNVIVNLSINSIIGRQRKVAPLTSGIGPFMCDMSLVASWPCVDRGRGGPYQRTDFFLLFSNKRLVLRRLLIKVRKKDVTAQ